AFAAFCHYLKWLQMRGVILAVCSKNDSESAAEVFRKHPEMPLHLDDFAAFVCNWRDKASNLRAIAAELNVDISSLVFVDDNPAERELVRQQVPEVTVVELPPDPSHFARQLDEQHFFDAAFLSQEDLTRASSYSARRRAIELQAQASDLDSYLRSLE